LIEERQVALGTSTSSKFLRNVQASIYENIYFLELKWTHKYHMLVGP